MYVLYMVLLLAITSYVCGFVLIVVWLLEIVLVCSCLRDFGLGLGGLAQYRELCCFVLSDLILGLLSVEVVGLAVKFGTAFSFHG